MDASVHDPAPRIDWIPASDFGDGRRGRLGMTVLPGKRGRSVRYPGRMYRSDLVRDLTALNDAGATRLILLVDDAELARWGNPAIVEQAATVGVRIERYPIADGSAPRDHATMESILAALADGRGQGDVAVACMGGVGRTGTVVACALVEAGWSAADAIARVRHVRHPTAVETPEQERFVRERERKYQRGTDGSSSTVAR